MTAIGMSRLAFFASPPSDVYRFESDQNQDGDRGLNEHPVEIVDSDYGFGIRMGLKHRRSAGVIHDRN